MPYESDLTADQWQLVESVFNVPGYGRPRACRGSAECGERMLHIAQTGCQWRYVAASFGPWTRVWSQFRRWSRNGTLAQTLTVLHAGTTAAASTAAPSAPSASSPST